MYTYYSYFLLILISELNSKKKIFNQFYLKNKNDNIVLSIN